MRLEGDDVTELVEEYRDRLPMSDEITTMDPPRHSAYRALVARYLTPKHMSRISQSHGARAWALEDARPPAARRLYRAIVSEHWVLDREKQPDERAPVDG